jgi:hypothetical protein
MIEIYTLGRCISFLLFSWAGYRLSFSQLLARFTDCSGKAGGK